MRICLISDTHNFFDEKIKEYSKDCDEIWHAGDIGSIEIYDKYASLTPKFRAVYGNIDNTEIRNTVPEVLFFTCNTKKILMIHIGGKPGSYYPDARNEIIKYEPDIFICGHSHICKVMYDKKYNLLHLNPGAFGKSGFHKVRTLLRFTIDKEKTVKDMEVIEIKR